MGYAGADLASVASILVWLEGPAFVLAGVPCSWAEVLGDVSGVACVALLARQNVWTWPTGLANNVLWALLFVRAQLYADGALQVVFFGLGVYGWWHWVQPAKTGRLEVRRAAPRELVVSGAIAMGATVALAAWLDRATDSPAPIADAAIFAWSLVATWGQAQKWLESWWIWIGVDVISVPLYLSRELYPTAIVYAGFGVLCVAGLRAWTRELRAREAVVLEPTLDRS